jgi:hypothetical protein
MLLAYRSAATLSIILCQMADTAVYDAVQAIDRRIEPYHVEIPEASGSPEAAAAHDVLVYLPRAGRVPRHDLPTVPGRPSPNFKYRRLDLSLAN